MTLNVLIVDDSSVTRAMVIKALKLTHLPLGDIHQAENGRQGLELLNQHAVDLAMIDINMPVMDGEEMIRAMRSNPKWETLPVIVISTEGSRTRIERFHRFGAEFIHKPFSPETVCQTVENLTGRNYDPQPCNTEL